MSEKYTNGLFARRNMISAEGTVAIPGPTFFSPLSLPSFFPRFPSSVSGAGPYDGLGLFFSTQYPLKSTLFPQSHFTFPLLTLTHITLTFPLAHPNNLLHKSPISKRSPE